MKWMLLSALILAVCSDITFAQTLVPVGRRVAPGYDSIREERLRADLTFLASDKLQSRRSLQPGDGVAIQWIASEFAKAGLKPGANGSYVQAVPLH